MGVYFVYGGRKLFCKCVNIVYLFTQKHTAFCFPGGFFMYTVLWMCIVNFQQRKT